jgi:predicted nucleotide-binding protein
MAPSVAYGYVSVGRAHIFAEPGGEIIAAKKSGDPITLPLDVAKVAGSDSELYLEVFTPRTTAGIAYMKARDITLLAAVEQSVEELGSDVSRDIFVIHGRDEVVRQRFFDFFRALGMRPQEWEYLVSGTGSTAPAIERVINEALKPGKAQAVVALLTPDDVVRLHPGLHSQNERAHEVESTLQPRPNVLIELGMALSAYRDRTILIEVGHLRPIADLAGLNSVRFNGGTESIFKIVGRLKLAGCKVDDSGTDWLNAERFSRLDAYDRRVTG